MADDAGEKPDAAIDAAEMTLRKRLPRRLPKRKNDIYVDRKTDFKAQLARCQKMFDSGKNEVFIHGLGAAVGRAVNLALQLKARGMGAIEISVNTSTVELVDDLEPEDDNAEPDVQTRNNSAVHIKVFRPTVPGTVKDKLNTTTGSTQSEPVEMVLGDGGAKSTSPVR